MARENSERQLFECLIEGHDDNWRVVLAWDSRDAAEKHAEHRCARWVSWPDDMVVKVRMLTKEREGEIERYAIVWRCDPTAYATKKKAK